MLYALLAVIAGLALLVWSAGRFVDGAAITARYAGIPPLLIGMVIVGFGTSAPEMLVSALASLDGNPGLALGNAYGSNISNIALILGLVAVISPVTVRSHVLRKEFPVLLAVTLFAGWQLYDGALSRGDALVLLAIFAGFMGWSIRQGLKGGPDALGEETAADLSQQHMSRGRALVWLIVGLLLLIASSRLLVWGAVTIAQTLGVSDLIIGLTVVAIGTSLPELASSIMAIRKNEHDIALGNVLGSNLFNTLAVVGIAGTIAPMSVEAVVLPRDWALMTALTASLFIFGYGFKRPGRINRVEGATWLVVFVVYTGSLTLQVITANQ